MEDGTTVLGNIEIKARSLIVNVNSAARAERAIDDDPRFAWLWRELKVEDLRR